MEDPPGYPMSLLVDVPKIKPVSGEDFVCYEVACFASSTRFSSREGRPINTTGTFVATDASGTNEMRVEVSTEVSRRSARNLDCNREAKGLRLIEEYRPSSFPAASEVASDDGGKHQ